MDIMRLDIKSSRTGTGQSYAKMLSDILKGRQFNNDQMEQIWRGLESGVDVNIYADPKLNADQMWQIRKGLEKS